MYPRHLFVGYKELPHSSSLVQATGLVVSSSIVTFSFSPSALSSFCTLAHTQSLMELLLVQVPGNNNTVQGEGLPLVQAPSATNSHK